MKFWFFTNLDGKQEGKKNERMGTRITGTGNLIRFMQKIRDNCLYFL